jgi:hypothetical protein
VSLAGSPVTRWDSIERVDISEAADPLVLDERDERSRREGRSVYCRSSTIPVGRDAGLARRGAVIVRAEALRLGSVAAGTVPAAWLYGKIHSDAER